MEKISKWGIPRDVVAVQRDYLNKMIESCPGKIAFRFFFLGECRRPAGVDISDL